MAKPIDRQTTTPFHLKLFYRSNAFHTLSDFPIPTPSEPTPPLPSHLQIYTWPSCSLRELSHLLTSALPSLLPSPSVGTRLSFRLVYPDSRPPPPGISDSKGRYISKEMGSVVVAPEEEVVDDDNDHPMNGDEPPAASSIGGLNIRGEDADKTLQDMRFIVGDYVDCAIFPPLGDGSVAPGVRAPSYSGGRGPQPRENGYGGGRGRGSYMGSGGGGGGAVGGRGGYGGSYGRDSGVSMPTGEWRRGERLPDTGGYGGGRGYDGRRGRGRGGW
ncbi:MAG: hypothetical protein Q9227_003957 [Pyrenula ochraceoflavens]